MSEMTKDEVNVSLFDECKRLQRQLAEAQAEIDSMRPVVEAAVACAGAGYLSIVLLEAVRDYEAKERP